MRRVLPFVLVASCTEPSANLPAPVANVTIARVTHEPTREDGLAPPIVRFSIELTSRITDARVLVIGGGANESDVLALAKNRATASLRAREIPSAAWLREGRVLVQPSRALPAGRSTIVVLPDKLAALSADVDVGDGVAVARRVWIDEKTVTHCADALPNSLPESVELAPSGVAARVVRHPGVPCFDVVGAVTHALLPPAIGGVFIDPAAVGAPDARPARGEPPCPEDAYPLPPLCIRVDDDRLVLVGGVETKRVLLGRFGPFPTFEILEPGARRVVRGFPELTPVPIELLVRDALGEHRISQTVTTRKRRRHVVINEVLARPPSGATSQRFVELVNDGDDPVDLAGLLFFDGDYEWELPPAILAPNAHALITAESYVDGLGGEPAPPAGVERLHVDSLRLSSMLTLEEPSGVVLSRFPPTTSTRTVARGRRTPDTPDDAPNAFGWDVRSSATPGRPNAIAQP